jgi:WD40 repeat protein/predicted Ser/Thr protein kinase
MAWNPGQELFGSRYIIERKLGEGGVGITYLAKNRRGELRVIKTLREQILNHPKWIPHQDKLRHDFRDEALRLALCHHPHIVQVENVFDEGNLPCMAMEYIAGEDLGKRITEKGALPEAEALEYIRQIGEALILVHEKGLLHRDLKPSNIMMRAGKPEAVLIDFGLARQFISGAVQQHTQSLTPGYAPPEQYAPVEQRGEYIDVYAFAATLYSLVTGQLPMPAPARLQNFTLQAPKELNGSVSDRVNEAIMKGMALNYKLRPQSVQEWLDLLDAGIVTSTQPVISSPQTPPSAITPPTQPVISPPNTPSSWECACIIPGNTGITVFSLKEDISVSVAGSVIHLFSSTTGQLLRSLTTNHSSWIQSVAISSDGRTLASGSHDNTIKLWDVQTAKEICTLNDDSMIRSLAFSSDGRTLASVTDDRTIKLWDVQTAKNICTRSYYGYAIAFSSDGQILTSGWQGGIKLWDVQTDREIYPRTCHAGSVYSFAISSDGRTLASGSADKTIKLWDVGTNWLQKIKIREIHTLTGHADSVDSVAFSNDGRTLASGSADKTIKLWEVVTGREIHTLTGHSDSIYSVAFNSDGQTLASSDNKTIKLWEVATGREISTLTSFSDNIGASVAISSDGQILASGSMTITLWSVATGKKIRTLSGHSDSVYSVAFSSDGRMLASGSADKTIKLWEVATGREIRTLTGHSNNVTCVAISSDGQTLASNSADKTIKLWSVTTGTEIRTLAHHSKQFYSIAITSDGQILASSNYFNTIKLWNVQTGREILTLTCNYGTAYHVAISSDGQMLAIGSLYKTVKLWEMQTGKEICTLDHFNYVHSVAFSPDGSWLAAGDDSGNIKIWRSQSGALALRS